MKRVSAACLLAVFAMAPSAGGAGATTQRLTPENRLSIVRHLAFEYALTRQPMPAAKKKEEALQVRDNGQVNQHKLREDLAKRGAAIYTGERIQITKVEFLKDSILLEINGGGKKGKKWYERISVGVGTGDGPTGPTIKREPLPGEPKTEPLRSGFGSWVVLKFQGEIPDVSAEDVKKLLAGVFDFDARTAAKPWIETIPEQFREPVKERRAVVGMTREIVLAAKGRPGRKVRELKDGIEYEDWIYGDPPFATFVTFRGDEVVEVKEYK